MAKEESEQLLPAPRAPPESCPLPHKWPRARSGPNASSSMITLGVGGRLCSAVRTGVRCPGLAETVQRQQLEQQELQLEHQQQPPPQSQDLSGYSLGRVRPAPSGLGSPRNVPGAPRALTLQPPPPWAPASSLRRAR